nr:hypothetical protein MarQu_418 [Marseillevirus sp.]
MHKNLHICSSNVPESTVTVFHYNMDGADREKAFAQSCPERREEPLKKMLDAYIETAKLYCLVEVTGERQRKWVTEFFNDRGFQVIFGMRNASPGCTANVIAWKLSDFRMESIENIQLLSEDATIPDDNSHTNGWGANLLLVHLHRIAEGKTIVPPQRLTVGCTHFPIHPQSRAMCTERLATWLDSNKERPYVVTGDLNTFHDKGGPDQVKKLQQASSNVLGTESVSATTGNKIFGSFLGYEHDAFKFALGNKLDPLDHIIMNSALIHPVGDVKCDTRTMLCPEPVELSTRDLPSDHLPLIAEFTF